MAGLDGIRKQLDPVELGFGPVDKNIYKLNGEESRRIRKVPRSLEEALEHLERDHEFLLEGGVFTEDLIQTWIDLKRAEAEMVRARPHPAEFALFFDA